MPICTGSSAVVRVNNRCRALHPGSTIIVAVVNVSTFRCSNCKRCIATQSSAIPSTANGITDSPRMPVVGTIVHLATSHILACDGIDTACAHRNWKPVSYSRVALRPRHTVVAAVVDVRCSHRCDCILASGIQARDLPVRNSRGALSVSMSIIATVVHITSVVRIGDKLTSAAHCNLIRSTNHRATGSPSLAVVRAIVSHQRTTRCHCI